MFMKLTKFEGDLPKIKYNSTRRMVEVDCIITDCEFAGDDSEVDFILVGFGQGFMCYMALIEAGNLQEALDEWADSDMAHLTLVDDNEEHEEWYSFAGNHSDVHDFQEIRIADDFSYSEIADIMQDCPEFAAELDIFTI